MKIGRNDRCPCGSGKKYKKCHLLLKQRPSESEVKEIWNNMQKEVQERRSMLESLGIYMDFVKPVIFKGKKCWALGSRVYYERPENETFHEFIIFILTQVLGEQWRLEQQSLPKSDQHFIYQCWLKYHEWRKKNATSQNITENGWAALPDGWSRSLVSLAFDICSLEHAEHLPEKLIDRLKNRRQYQGARYEITIAAMFARLGYKITFLDEVETQKVHPEFIAEDRITGEKIAVEVKSKEREGVLHTPGKTENEERLLWGDIQRPYRQALKQNPGNLPFLIFIDMNCPQTPDVPWEEKHWIKDIRKMIAKAPLHDPHNPDPCSGLIFTNYSYHYQTENESLPGEHLLTWPLFPIFPVKRADFINILEFALSKYGNVPNLDNTIQR